MRQIDCHEEIGRFDPLTPEFPNVNGVRLSSIHDYRLTYYYATYSPSESIINLL